MHTEGDTNTQEQQVKDARRQRLGLATQEGDAEKKSEPDTDDELLSDASEDEVHPDESNWRELLARV